MIRLLIVDDSPLMRKLLTDLITEAGGFEISVARSAEEALHQLQDFAPDLITLDIHMPGMDGLACLDRIMVERPTPVVMVSSLTEEGAAETLEALSLGAVDFVAKPSGPISLGIGRIAPALIDKLRSAATARISKAARLSDRVRLRREAPVPAKPGRTSRKRAARGERLSNIEAVLVGVSTGGPPALDALLQPLPKDFPWPIVIAQHMPRAFTAPLAARLNAKCELTVVEADRAMPLEPGLVYIGRGDADLLLSRRNRIPTVVPAPAKPSLPWHPSTDRLVESAMQTLGPERLIGVLMTGMGSDGARAMADLRREGGHVIAQDAETSVVWGMPGALVELEGADVVLPLLEIPSRLIEWAGV